MFLKIISSFWLAIAWGVFIIVVSVIPGNKLHLPPIWNADKYAHIFVYFVFTLFAIYGYSRYVKKEFRPGKVLITIAMVAIVLGAFLELVQYALPTRSGDYFDFIANSLGAVIAVLFVKFLKPIHRILSR